MDDKIYMVVLVAILLGGFYLVSVSLSSAPESPVYVNIQNGSALSVEHNTVSTSGEALRYVEPDKMTVSFSVQTEDRSATEAQDENAEKVNDITAALKAMGINEEDIKTTYYYVNVKKESHYICRNETYESDCYWTYRNVGYQVQHTLSVDVYEVDKGGEIVDAIVDEDGEVDYISLGLKKETQMEINKDLLSEAAANAKEKAEGIAEGLGASVTNVLSVSESYSYYPSPYRSYDYGVGYAEAAYDSMETSISTGTIEVSASVSATFEIQ